MEPAIDIRQVGSEQYPRYDLHVGTARVANLRVVSGYVKLDWLVAGPQQWPEAKYVLIGLLHLSLLADKMHLVEEHNRENPHRSPKTHGNRSVKRARRSSVSDD